MVVSTGVSRLDEILGGGIPDRRAVLVTGGPGVGKSTLAMQFLQAGLENDEECLYVSTEQTVEELRSSFAPFVFDLDHEALTITSVHAAPDSTLVEGETGLALRTLEGEGTAEGPYNFPFEEEYVKEYLEGFGPCDRVVFDSISGLSALSETPNQFRRVVLELIRLFTDTFGATTIFTAEEFSTTEGDMALTTRGSSDILQFTTHGVVRLWWEELRGSRRRLLQVVKMRGVEHDTREFELGFDERGVFLTPQRRAYGYAVDDGDLISTEVRGLDAVCGGGLVTGHSVLLEHDGRARVDDLVANICHGALSGGMSLWLIPSPILGPERLEMLLPDSRDIEGLLADNRLFVLDGFSTWDAYEDSPNVFRPPSGGVTGSLLHLSSLFSLRLIRSIIRKIDARRETPVWSPVYTEAFLRWLSPSEVREVYYWAREEIAREHDTGFFVHNPKTMEPRLAEFFHSDAEQVLNTWMGENGIQYVRLDKSPMGRPGTTSVVEYAPTGPTISKSG